MKMLRLLGPTVLCLGVLLSGANAQLVPQPAQYSASGFGHAYADDMYTSDLDEGWSGGSGVRKVEDTLVASAGGSLALIYYSAESDLEEPSPGVFHIWNGAGIEMTLVADDDGGAEGDADAQSHRTQAFEIPNTPPPTGYVYIVEGRCYANRDGGLTSDAGVGISGKGLGASASDYFIEYSFPYDIIGAGLADFDIQSGYSETDAHVSGNFKVKVEPGEDINVVPGSMATSASLFGVYAGEDAYEEAHAGSRIHGLTLTLVEEHLVETRRFSCEFDWDGSLIEVHESTDDDDYGDGDDDYGDDGYGDDDYDDGCC